LSWAARNPGIDPGRSERTNLGHDQLANEESPYPDEYELARGAKPVKGSRAHGAVLGLALPKTLIAEAYRHLEWFYLLLFHVARGAGVEKFAKPAIVEGP
jgi:hypothetical protein